MNTIWTDVRYVLRQLRRSPGFTATAVVTLALGIGATTGVYSVVRSVLVDALPYPEPDRLVGVAFTFPLERPNAEETGVSAMFVREHSDVFASSAVMDDGASAVNFSVAGGRAVQVRSLRVSEGYFRTVGLMPAPGRAFSADEDRPGGARVAILSHGLWERALGSDPGVIGRGVRINQEDFTVVGVMPAGFAVSAATSSGALASPDVWMPLQLSPRDPGYDGDNYQMIARLRRGVTMEQARQQLSALRDPFHAQFPNYKSWVAENDKSLHEFRVWSLQEVLTAEVRRSLMVVLGAVAAVLLVACLNLAGLMLARFTRRRREMAVRSALGARRAQMFRLIAVEGGVIALASGAVAVGIAGATVRLLLAAAPLPIPRLHSDPSLWRLSGVALVIALAATVLFAIVPGWMVMRGQGRQARLNGPVLGETIAQVRTSRALLVGQVAVAMVLVSSASVLLGTFVRLQALPSGVEPKHLTVFQVSLKGDRYARTQRTMQFVDAVLDELRRVPGVDRVAAVNGLPLDRGLNEGGYPSGRKDMRQTVEFRAVTPGYFQTMGMSLMAGRDFTEADRAGTDRVVVISATTAKRWWPGGSPIGAGIQLGAGESWRVVGIVPDVQMHSLVESQGIEIYAPMAQLSDETTGVLNGWFPQTFAIRTAGGVDLAKAVMRAVQQADADIPVARLDTMQDVIDSTIEAPRFFSIITSGFSAFALVLAVIGLFGLLSYQVTQRTREIGVRMALGADRLAILWAYIGRGLTLASAGAAAGLLATVLLHPMLRQLFEDAGIDARAQRLVGPGMGATVLAIGAVLATSLAASWLPARRAASIEPMQALRTE